MLTTLQERLKLIRSLYRFPINEAPWLCDGVSKSGISAWESGARIPAIDNVYAIALSYGVSLDWLTGISEEQYTEASVSVAENAHPVSEDDLLGLIPDAVSGRLLRMPGVTEQAITDAARRYGDTEKRRAFWSLEARASIVVLIHYTQKLFSTLDWPYDTELTQSQSRRLNEYRIFLLWTLIHGKTPTEIQRGK